MEKVQIINKIYYLSGEEVLLGDIVKLGDSDGIIVFVISSNQYSESYPESAWGYLQHGFGVLTEKYGLIHQIKSDEDIILIRRS